MGSEEKGEGPTGTFEADGEHRSVRVRERVALTLSGTHLACLVVVVARSGQSWWWS